MNAYRTYKERTYDGGVPEFGMQHQRGCEHESFSGGKRQRDSACGVCVLADSQTCFARFLFALAYPDEGGTLFAQVFLVRIVPSKILMEGR